MDEARSRPLALWDFVQESGLRSLVIGVSKDPNAKITVLLLSPKSGRPELAIKAPTTDRAATAVESEMRLLSQLQALQLGPLANTIPRVGNVVDFEGRPAAVMTAVHGTPMTTFYMRRRHTADRGRVAADFAAVQNWLNGFQHATASGAGPLDMDAGVSRRLQSRFLEEQLDPALERLAEIHARLAEHTVVRTAVHGDLWMGNILMAGARASGVVDWEAGACTGQPVRDLVRFAHIYALYLDRRTRVGRRVSGHRGLRSGSWGAGIRYALDGSGWFPELFRGFLQDGLARVGAPSASWRDAALAGIAEVAALTDEPDFARLHLELFRSLAGGPVRPHSG